MMNQEREFWVFVDARFAGEEEAGLGILSGLQKLRPGRVAALWVENSDSPRDDDNGWERLVRHGADRIMRLEAGESADTRSLAEAVSSALSAADPQAVFFPLSSRGRETAAMAAALQGCGLISECMHLEEDEDNGLVAVCPSWGGEIMARLVFSRPGETGFVTLHPRAFEKEERPGEGREVIEIAPPEKAATGFRLIERTPLPPDREGLEDAGVVVVGGAGMGSSREFGKLRRLAAALGGEMGATRPPVLWHWIEEERLIGQTGKTIAPDLLLVVGASGAIQFTAGITGAGTIVAVNRDPHAAIFDVADLGIVADAAEFIPILTEKAKVHLLRTLTDTRGESGEKESFGEKIRLLREGQGWTLEKLAGATGQTPDFITRVESDEIVPPVGFLLRLSGALGMDPSAFLREEEVADLTDIRARAFLKRTKNYYYQTLTPGAENEHLRVFMVTIPAKQDHKPVAYRHEGEEFVFVMEGAVELSVGEKVRKLMPGESFHFNSEISHRLKNLAQEETRCLVVLYTP